jgi:adenosylcobinamide-phosphate synthase
MSATWIATLTPHLPALGCALAWDALLGEPPNAIHPVVWFGWVAKRLERAALGRGRTVELLAGSAIALGLPCMCALLAALTLSLMARDSLLAIAFETFLLKSCFSLRALLGAGRQVCSSLDAGTLENARYDLRNLCSRDASGLDASLVAAAAIESLAENTSDSVVAPLLYYGCFGLPGAVFYRAVNTLDAMIGYHGQYEHLGKASARLDDLLNLLPARLTAVALMIAAALLGRDPRRGLRVLRRDGGKPESPNAGRPMATMAGLLQVELTKPGHYTLGAGGAAANGRMIRTALRLVACAAGLAALATVLAVEARHG